MSFCCNAKDGMIMVRGDNFSVSAVATPKKFGVIERYAERIWGGAIEDDPDMLVYSAPFDPTDWKARNENPDPDDPWQEEGEPEDGAGDLNQPSWDGDSFTALRSFGSQLIAFKRTRVWRILGTDPGEYTFKEQYGGGAPYFNTIAVDTERILMMDKDGMNVYDGLSVNPYYREPAEALWRTVNHAALDQMCAALFQKKYYVAFPTGTSTTNNALLVFNFRDGTVLYRNDISIESFLVAGDALYATSSTLPGKILKINYDSWITGTATDSPAKWVSPWMDFGYKRMTKGGFELYFTPEVKDEAVTLKFTVETEKKNKSKSYTVQPLTAEQMANGKEYKQKRLHIAGTGRRFRIVIEATSSAPWRLIGGIQMVVETDTD